MRDFEILEHLGLWEEKTLFERAPPYLIREKSYEPYDDGRSLPLVAYLAAVRGTVGQHPLSLVFYDCNFRLMDWCAVLQGY
jgi:hypothetical protein